MASRTQWTQVWVNSGRWWWTGRPGVLRFMGSQKVRQDWATELHCIGLDIYFTVRMCHTSFIHSSVNGHLGCFHVLAIVNSAAMNFKVHVSFQIRVFLGYTPRSGVAGSYGNSVFSSEENSDFSLVAAPVYIPTNSVGGFCFRHTLSNICYL